MAERTYVYEARSTYDTHIQAHLNLLMTLSIDLILIMEHYKAEYEWVTSDYDKVRL